jgi:hypothetical protein
MFSLFLFSSFQLPICALRKSLLRILITLVYDASNPEVKKVRTKGRCGPINRNVYKDMEQNRNVLILIEQSSSIENILTYSIPPKEGYSHSSIPRSAQKYPTETCHK